MTKLLRKMTLMIFASVIFFVFLCSFAGSDDTLAAADVCSELSLTADVEAAQPSGEAIETWDISHATAASSDVHASIYEHPTREGMHLLVIEGTGQMADWSSTSSVPWYSAYRKTIAAVTVGEGITSVGVNAFNLCTALCEVTLPSGLILVSPLAFYMCEALETLTLPDSVTTIGHSAFGYCTALREITLSESLSKIYTAAFASCTALESIVIPKKVSSIEERAFSGCTSLTEILVDGENTVYSSEDGNLYSADGKTLRIYAPGKSAAAFTVPDRITTVSSYAFENCILSEIVLGTSVTSIGEYALAASYNLRSVVIPSSVRTVGRWAFSDCISLEAIDLASVTEISAYAFYNCSSLKEIALPDTLLTLGSCAFYKCSGLESLTVGSSLLAIGDYAFWKCTSLKSLDLGNTLTSLGVAAFRDCTALCEVSIPESVSSVGAYAFGGCQALSVVRIFSSAVVGELVSDTWAGLALTNVTNLYIPREIIENEEYIAAEFKSRTPIVLGGTLFILYSNCDHEWYLADGGYRCAACLAERSLSELVASNITLGADLSVNVYASVEVGASVLFALNGTSVSSYGTYVESLGLWKYTFCGITPQMTGDRLEAYLVAEGEILHSLENCGVKAYCDKLLAMSKESIGLSDAKFSALRVLVCDLLDYAAAAQKYTDYKSDTPVNEGIEGASEFVELTSTDMKLTAVSKVDGVKFTAANLRFNSASQLRFKFTAPDVGLVRIVLTEGDVSAEYTEEDFVFEDGVYSLYTDPIFADEFDDVYYATLIYDGAEVQTAAYSVRSYVYSKQNSSDAALSELVRAVYKYGLSAKAFVKAN